MYDLFLLLSSLFILALITWIDRLHPLFKTWNKQKEQEELERQEKAEQERQKKDPRYILKRYYYESIRNEKGDEGVYYMVRCCLDSDFELRKSLERLQSLKNFNDASYLICVEDAIRETFTYAESNLKHIVNYLIADGCVDDYTREPSKKHVQEIKVLVQRNETILAHVEKLLDEAVSLVNHYGELKDEEILASLNTSIATMRDIILA